EEPPFCSSRAAFWSERTFIIYHSGPVMHTEEKPPATMPTIRGRANSLMVGTPTTYRAAMVTKVVKEVYTLLVRVWVILLFTTWASGSFFPLSRRFSRIRSKITMVALME